MRVKTRCAVWAAAVAVRAMTWGAELFSTTFDLDPGASHVQGICCSDEAVYFSQDKFLYKCDWRGNLVRKVAAVNHTGDLCWSEGRLYASICLRKPEPGGEKGFIIVYDGDLDEVRRSKPFMRPADGIVRLGNTLYVGLGSNTPDPPKPHRKNFFAKFDPKTLEMVGQMQSVDYGFETRFGVQDIATDGKRLLCMFYGVGDGPWTAIVDTDFNLIRPVRDFMACNGLDLLPASHGGDGKTWLRATTVDRRCSGGVEERRIRVSFDTVVFDGKDGNGR